MYNEKSNIYTITIISFDSVRRNFDERSLMKSANGLTQDLRVVIMTMISFKHIEKLAVSSRQRSSTILLTSLLY